MCQTEICETDVQISLRQEILNYNLGTNSESINFELRIELLIRDPRILSIGRRSRSRYLIGCGIPLWLPVECHTATINWATELRLKKLSFTF